MLYEQISSNSILELFNLKLGEYKRTACNRDIFTFDMGRPRGRSDKKFKCDT